MAFSKKNNRRITVDNHLLFWSATGGDNGIRVMIMSEVEGSGKVSAAFDYHHIRVEAMYNGVACTHLTDQFVITPYIIRQVVQLALQEGWKPLEKSAGLWLGFVDDKVDLRLNQNRARCFK